MKYATSFIIILGLLIGTSFTLKAQQSGTLPLPEFNYQVMVLQVDNTLADLDKATMTTYNSTKILGGGNRYIQASGCCSRASHSGNTADKFIVRVEPGIDPSSMYELIQFETSKNVRRIMVQKITTMSALNGTTEIDVPSIPFQAKKVAEGVYILTLDKALESGEYVFLKGRKTTDGFTTQYNGNAFHVGESSK